MKGFFYVLADGEVFNCKIKRSLFKEKNVSCVPGDNVSFEPQNSDNGLIVSVKERENVLRRADIRTGQPLDIAANLDLVLICESSERVSERLEEIMHYVISSSAGEIPQILLKTKKDLSSETFEFPGLKDISVSSYSCEGIEELKEVIKGRRTVVIGPSGVGKSTLLNVLFPGLRQKTASINEKYGFGRHTTVLGQLLFPEDEYEIVDTPGIRHFRLYGANKSKLAHYLPIFKDFRSCKLRDCVHETEPGCELRRKVSEGSFSNAYYQAYLNILKTLGK